MVVGSIVRHGGSGFWLLTGRFNRGLGNESAVQPRFIPLTAVCCQSVAQLCRLTVTTVPFGLLAAIGYISSRFVGDHKQLRAFRNNRIGTSNTELVVSFDDFTSGREPGPLARCHTFEGSSKIRSV